MGTHCCVMFNSGSTENGTQGRSLEMRLISALNGGGGRGARLFILIPARPGLALCSSAACCGLWTDGLVGRPALKLRTGQEPPGPVTDSRTAALRPRGILPLAVNSTGQPANRRVGIPQASRWPSPRPGPVCCEDSLLLLDPGKSLSWGP